MHPSFVCRLKPPWKPFGVRRLDAALDCEPRLVATGRAAETPTTSTRAAETARRMRSRASALHMLQAHARAARTMKEGDRASFEPQHVPERRHAGQVHAVALSTHGSANPRP